MSKTYSEKLRDPRWQKKRLEILERDKWACQMCSTAEHTLNVHHKRYIYGSDPWDAPNNALITLCEGCHENESGLKDSLTYLRAVVAERFSADEVQLLAELLDERTDPAWWGKDCLGPLYLHRLLGRSREKSVQSARLVSPWGLH